VNAIQKIGGMAWAAEKCGIRGKMRKKSGGIALKLYLMVEIVIWGVKKSAKILGRR
jgi:hypothetical protein